jgi:hypothetical protein
MTISSFSFFLLLLLIPGILSTLFFEKITEHKKKWSFQFLLLACFLFCIFSNFFYQLILQLICIDIIPFFKNDTLECFNLIKNVLVYNPENFSLSEIVFICYIGFILSVFVSWLENKKILLKIFKFFGITSKYGDESLFDYALNSEDTDWVFVRDFQRKITYKGRVLAFNLDGNTKELLLSDVIVYELKTSDEMYEMNQIYLIINNNMQIDIVKAKETDDEY